MPTPTTPISLRDVNIELYGTDNAEQEISMDDSAVRELAGVGTSGTTISMDNLGGKSKGSSPWYIGISPDVTGDDGGQYSRGAWTIGGLIVDEVTTEKGKVLSVLPPGNPGNNSGGKKIFSYTTPSWSNFYGDFQTDMTKRAFYYVDDGSWYVNIVTRDFTFDWHRQDQNWDHSYVWTPEIDYDAYQSWRQGFPPPVPPPQRRVVFGNYNTIHGGSISNQATGTYTNPSTTPGGTGGMNKGKSYEIARFTWNGTSNHANSNPGMTLKIGLTAQSS